MRTRLGVFLGGLAVIAVTFLVARSFRPFRPAFVDLPAAIEGTFPPQGEFHGEPLAEGDALRRWGSYAGADTNTGTLRLGPFPASHRLRFESTGYPAATGNHVYVERADTHERFPIGVGNVGASWRLVDVDLPPDWKGHPVVLTAVDGATNDTGWLGLTEPLRGGISEGRGAFYLSLTCWLLNGLLLGATWIAALAFTKRMPQVPAVWQPLTAAALVAAVGYGLFWCYLASRPFGVAASVIVVLASLSMAIRQGVTDGNRSGDDAATRDRHVRTVGGLMIAIGFFYLALLHLFPSSLDFYALAQNRLREGLPGDNGLPHQTAWKLFTQTPLRDPGAEWQSSDRPPLQSGCQLITLPFAVALKLDERTATGTAAIWLQLLWIPAAYAMLVELGVRSRRAVAWIVVLSLTGFFAQNTLYTWPKLSSGAFGCGAAFFWLFPLQGRRNATTGFLGGMMAGLAWLSHGGIAFSLLPLVPWALWRMFRGEARMWLFAAVGILVLALPWSAYQKFYDPPGDRLLKWHLGGSIPPDRRPFGVVLRTNYQAKSWDEILDNKRKNFVALILGNTPRGQFDFRTATAADRRNDEFFWICRALTWWIFAPAIVTVAMAWRLVRRRIRSAANGQTAASARPVAMHLGLALWTAATVVLWCLLMFFPYSTAIHQGSYATMIVLFVLGSAWLEHAGRGWLLLVGGLQLATFVTTWAWSNSQVHGEPTGWPFLTIAAVALAAGYFMGVIARRPHIGESEVAAPRPAAN